MDFFDLSKSFKPIVLKGGQTQGYVRPDDEDFSEPRPKSKGKSYVKKYLRREIIAAAEAADAEEASTSTAAASSAVEKANTVKLTTDMSALDLTSVGSFEDPNELNQEDLTQIYKTYFKNKPRIRSNLTINDFRQKILSMIEVNETTIITGPTGCGKTTQVPQFILDSFVEKNRYCNIIVTQPRRIAAISISKRVCDERDWELGTICGYKVGLKNCTSDDTRLTYITIGVFLQMLINSKNMNNFTHVILDEVHERDQTTDFALLVVRKLLRSCSRNVKVTVILMSATAEVEKFATYFQTRVSGKRYPAPVLNIGKYTNFLVQVHYLDELSALGELPEITADDPCISDLAMMTCIKLIKQFERLDRSSRDKKSVLVFLPGIYEIENLFNKLKDPKISLTGPKEYKWLLIPLHSSITTEEQAIAFRPPPQGYRKIILATNIGESSITVPDVMFVIDFCLTKVLVTDTKTNFSSLQLVWASKANCIQRAGRVGRVMEGRVYRMVYKAFYMVRDQTLDEQSIPGMLRCPLDKVVLQSKLLDMGCPEAVLALALDPPDLENIERTIVILKESGGLLVTAKGVVSSSDGDLTCLGRLMALLPVDIHITKLILLGHVFSCLNECIVMGAAMSLKSVFSSPFRERLKSYNSKLEWADGSCSDCIAFLNVYDVWKMNHSNGYFRRSAGGGEVGWAKRHFIQLRALREVDVLVTELTNRLKGHNIVNPSGVGRVQWNDMEKAFVLKFVIAGAFYPNYFGRGARGGQVNEEVAVKTLGGRDPFTSVYLQNYPLDQPPDLYSYQIKKQLAECKEKMKISYDNSSKVYIEFRKQKFESSSAEMPFSCAVPGKISMAVYRAVKLRQIMKYVEIDALNVIQAKETAEKLGLIKQNDLFSSGPSTSRILTENFFLTSIPGVDVNVTKIKITHVLEPSHFWAVIKDEINDQFEREIFESLNDSEAQLENYGKVPDIGEMCIAPYEGDGVSSLFRAKVEALREEDRHWFAQVYFIDYGNTEVVPVSQLLKYNAQLLCTLGRIPALCFECTLCKVEPSILKHPSGKWTNEAKEKFKELIQNAKLIASVYSVVGGVASITLFKVIDSETESRQMNINEYLIRYGYAQEVEESYLSKENNELRTQGQLDSAQQNVYNTLQNSSSSSDWQGDSFQPPNHQKSKLKLKLGGPFSPLEMKIFSLTKSGLSKHVTVSPSSVNSVLLDTDPQDPHERLIVAASVCTNQSGSNLILYNSTILPNIHGLASLIPIVFAPTVELRTNKKRTKYTGVLCGLGADESFRPLFSEHDMEIVFDSEITAEDITTVNRLRFFMSLLLLSDGEDFEPVSSNPDVLTFQNDVKTSLLKLIDQERESQELEFPKKEFKWGLFEHDLFPNPDLAVTYTKNSVFPQHSRIHITPRNKKSLLVHAEGLVTVAQKNVELQAEVECELCDVRLPNLTAVKQHLTTDSHKTKYLKLRKSLKESA